MERPRDAYESARARMVEEQLARREVTDERVLAVMRRVPRHLFVEEKLSRKERRQFAQMLEDLERPRGKGE